MGAHSRAWTWPCLEPDCVEYSCCLDCVELNPGSGPSFYQMPSEMTSFFCVVVRFLPIPFSGGVLIQHVLLNKTVPSCM